MTRADFRFAWPFRVRYSEIDGQKIVFNAHYLTYFDTAIHEYIRALDEAYETPVDRTDQEFHTVRALVEYRKPIVFDEDIEVHARATRLGRSSMTFTLEIHPAGAEDLRATGEIVWVNASRTTHRPVPVSDTLAERLAAFEGEGLER